MWELIAEKTIFPHCPLVTKLIVLLIILYQWVHLRVHFRRRRGGIRLLDISFPHLSLRSLFGLLIHIYTADIATSTLL